MSLSSYLIDRLPCIVIDGVTSEPVNLRFCVSQGSVLGPLVFTKYTSPLMRLHETIMLKYIFMLMTLSCIYIYIYFKMKVPSSQLETLMLIQSRVSEIRSWMAYNKLKFNDDKSEFLVVCAHWSRDKIHVETLTVGLSYGDRAFSVKAPSLWNSLPLYMRKVKVQVYSLESSLKTYHLTSHFTP